MCELSYMKRVFILAILLLCASLYGDDFYDIKEKAEQGDKVAQYELALYYEEGKDGVRLDRIDAFEWMKKSAEQGYAPAEYILGTYYSKGIGVRMNYELAYKWISESANHGYSEAQVMMYCMLKYEWLGTKKNLSKAVKWLVLAAKNENGGAQNIVGVNYKNGEDGFPKKYKEALKWFVKAGENGSSKGYLNAAKMYMNNLVGPKDVKIIYEYINKSACMGEAEAIYILHVFYLNGVCVERDERKAERLKQLAKIRGFAPYEPKTESGYVGPRYHHSPQF